MKLYGYLKRDINERNNFLKMDEENEKKQEITYCEAFAIEYSILKQSKTSIMFTLS